MLIRELLTAIFFCVISVIKRKETIYYTIYITPYILHYNVRKLKKQVLLFITIQESTYFATVHPAGERSQNEL